MSLAPVPQQPVVRTQNSAFTFVVPKKTAADKVSSAALPPLQTAAKEYAAKEANGTFGEKNPPMSLSHIKENWKKVPDGLKSNGCFESLISRIMAHVVPLSWYHGVTITWDPGTYMNEIPAVLKTRLALSGTCEAFNGVLYCFKSTENHGNALFFRMLDSKLSAMPSDGKMATSIRIFKDGTNFLIRKPFQIGNGQVPHVSQPAELKPIFSKGDAATLIQRIKTVIPIQWWSRGLVFSFDRGSSIRINSFLTYFHAAPLKGENYSGTIQPIKHPKFKLYFRSMDSITTLPADIPARLRIFKDGSNFIVEAPRYVQK